MGALWSVLVLGKQRNVERQICLRLPLLVLGLLAILAQRRSLRIDANPGVVLALENVRKHALLVGFVVRHLMMQDVGSVGHGNVAEETDGDDALFQATGFCPAR